MLLLVIFEFHFHRNNTLKCPPFPYQKPHLEKACSASSLKLTAVPLRGKGGNPDRLVREDRAGCLGSSSDDSLHQKNHKAKPLQTVVICTASQSIQDELGGSARCMGELRAHTHTYICRWGNSCRVRTKQVIDVLFKEYVEGHIISGQTLVKLSILQRKKIFK